MGIGEFVFSCFGVVCVRSGCRRVRGSFRCRLEEFVI